MYCVEFLESNAHCDRRNDRHCTTDSTVRLALVDNAIYCTVQGVENTHHGTSSTERCSTAVCIVTRVCARRISSRRRRRDESSHTSLWAVCHAPSTDVCRCSVFPHAERRTRIFPADTPSVSSLKYSLQYNVLPLLIALPSLRTSRRLKDSSLARIRS